MPIHKNPRPLPRTNGGSAKVFVIVEQSTNAIALASSEDSTIVRSLSFLAPFKRSLFYTDNGTIDEMRTAHPGLPKTGIVRVDA